MSLLNSRIEGPKFTILSQSEIDMQSKAIEEDNTIAREELESVKTSLINMNHKMK